MYDRTLVIGALAVLVLTLVLLCSNRRRHQPKMVVERRRPHSWIGKKVVVTPYARNVPPDLIGSTSRIMEAQPNSSTLPEQLIIESLPGVSLTRRDLYIEGQKQTLEDTDPGSRPVRELREALRHWETPRNYPKGDSEGWERLHFELAKRTDSVIMERQAGERYIMWRLVLTETRPTSAIDCFATFTDTSNILSIVPLDVIAPPKKQAALADPDIWKRSMMWTEAIAPQSMKEELNERMRRAEFIRERVLPDLKKVVGEAFQKALHRKADFPERISLAINRWDLPLGTLGSFKMVEDQGLITVSSHVAWNDEVVKFVVLHELVHAAFGDYCCEGHGPEFDKVAALAGLPREYSD